MQRKKKVWRAYATVGTQYMPDWYILHEGGFLWTYFRAWRFRGKHPFCAVRVVPEEGWSEFESRLAELDFTLAELP